MFGLLILVWNLLSAAARVSAPSYMRLACFSCLVGVNLHQVSLLGPSISAQQTIGIVKDHAYDGAFDGTRAFALAFKSNCVKSSAWHGICVSLCWHPNAKR